MKQWVTDNPATQHYKITTTVLKLYQKIGFILVHADVCFLKYSYNVVVHEVDEVVVVDLTTYNNHKKKKKKKKGHHQSSSLQRRNKNKRTT
jgi:hypothetical protein